MADIKILEAVAGMNVGGAETFLMNVFRIFHADGKTVDFAENKIVPSFYDKEITSCGGKVFYCGSKLGLPFYTFNIYKTLRRGKYTAVHAHMHFFNAFPLLAAWVAGVQVRVSHSHNTQSGGNVSLIRKIYEFCARRIILLFATDLLACSAPSGRALYGGVAEFKIIPNGINCTDFEFNQNTRAQVRESLGLGDSFVIGHIGRFVKIKNQSFLTETLNLLLKEDKNIKLMFIGAGELEEEVKNKAEEMGIKDNVLFMGLRKDANRLLQAMDIFALPSIHEALPLSALEAQAAGLPCLFTEILTREMDIFKCSYLPLKQEVWKDEILKFKTLSVDRAQGAAAVRKAGYDAKEAAEILLKFYKGVK